MGPFDFLRIDPDSAAMSEAIRRGQLASPLTDDQVAILRDGAASVHDTHNALAGYGFAAGALAQKGFMVSAGVRSDGHGYLWHDYKRTEAGRKAYLAAIGVREIAPA